MRTDVNSLDAVKKAPRSLVLTKLALGAALTLSLAGFAGATPAAAQDDEIVLSGGGATLTVSPGHASAEATIASAEAGPGWAVTEGAAARAVADCEDGALAEGAAALAVAHPDTGAMVEAAIAEAKAAARDEFGVEKEVKPDVELKCKDREEREVEPPAVETPEEEVVEVPVVEEVPSTGTGAELAGLSGLLGAAAAAAALGAVAFRRREDAAGVGVRY